jgi:DNA-binding response OmpR family regulator
MLSKRRLVGGRLPQNSTSRASWAARIFRSLGRTRTLDSHASRLRRKLNRSGEAAYVLNVWGVGYRLVAAA